MATRCWALAEIEDVAQARCELFTAIARDPALLGTRPVLGALRRFCSVGPSTNHWRSRSTTSGKKRISSVLADIVSIPLDWHKEGTVESAALLGLARLLRDHTVNHSIETGTGRTTLMLSHLSREHTVFTMGDRADSSMKVLEHPLLKRETVTFVEGPTQRTLLSFEFRHALDFAMLDGPHGFPFRPRLAFAILVVDDIHIPTVANLFAFLCEDAMFELIEVIATTGFLRRTHAPTFPTDADAWWEQNYNRIHFPVPIRP
jgi:hypothetical protein